MQLHRLLYMEEVKWLKFMLSHELAVRPPMNDKKEAKLLAGNCVKLHRDGEIIGYAEIRKVFSVSKIGKIAGCLVNEGIVKKGCSFRLLRDNTVVHQGMLKTLRRFKDEVKEVREGTECGMGFENYNDIQEGDVMECFEVKEVARSLDSIDKKVG